MTKEKREVKTLISDKVFSEIQREKKKEKLPKIEDLVEYGGIWYKKGKGNKCDRFTMVDLRELLAQEKQKYRQEILEEIEKYKEWVDLISEEQKEKGNIMIAYDMNSRYVAAKQIMERLKKKSKN
jgi:hypothetical protein